MVRAGAVVLATLALVGAASQRARAADAVPVGQLSADTLTDPAAQHATEAEPDSFAVGDTVVTAFQVGRFFDGGSDAIGFATSHDGGRSWASGLLPSLTRTAPVAGPYARATDPAVAYDSAHAVWLVVSLALGDSIPPPASGGPAFFTSVVVSRSTDGIVWSAPQTVAGPAPGAFDKEWIACDNGASSPFRGRCYVSYTDFSDGLRIATHASAGGGHTWTLAAKSPNAGAAGIGAQLVVEPNGAVILPFRDLDGLVVALRSIDGGATFGA